MTDGRFLLCPSVNFGVRQFAGKIFLSDLCPMSGAPLCVAFDAQDLPTVPGVTNETVHSQTSIL